MSGSRWLPNGTPSRSDIATGAGRRPARVTPFGGLQPLLGTNPVAAAVPLGERPPLVIDFATSAVAEGKVRVARNLGKSIPEGWILDKHGNPTTNPADLYDDGVLLPAAGHKGYGLSLLVELLAGVLAGNSCPGLPDYSPRNGVLFIVLDVAAFQPADQFNATTGAYAGVIKALKPAPGFKKCCCRASRSSATSINAAPKAFPWTTPVGAICWRRPPNTAFPCRKHKALRQTPQAAAIVVRHTADTTRTDKRGSVK